MQPWKTQSREVVLDKGKFLKVEQHAVKLPDGTVIPDWQWVVTPDFVNVVAITEEGNFLCFRQTKYAVEGTALAPVGGYLEPGEDVLLAAKRELLEETGYEAPTWEYLGGWPVDGNRGCGTAYAYLATGATRKTAPDADDLEEQEMLLLNRDEVQAALLNGEFKVLPWANCMALALLTLGNR